ncbi:MAG TPA: diaminopimelate epimerase [Rhizomicrobium sp.]|nr:diaminopimelate epimerase [Rhizomicrobium sp.]
MTAFLKMHGLGNDFVVFDGRQSGIPLEPALARAVADRRLGIGCDQVIVMEPSKNGAEIAMRILNADGSEVESCGNAARCIARLLMEEKDVGSVKIETAGGPLLCTDAGRGLVTVDIGAPRFDWKDIPLSKAVDTNGFDVAVDGASFKASAANVGNPHCVLFVDDAEKARVAELGPKLEHHPLFPARTNVEFVSVLSPDRLRMRVWERGVGITRACGTGACATAVAAHRRGLAGRNVDIVLDGGVLNIQWRAGDDHILMTGPSSLSFAGDVDLASLERAQ